MFRCETRVISAGVGSKPRIFDEDAFRDDGEVQRVGQCAAVSDGGSVAGRVISKGRRHVFQESPRKRGSPFEVANIRGFMAQMLALR